MKYDLYPHYWDKKNHVPLMDEINQVENGYWVAKLCSLGTIESTIKEEARTRYKQRFLKYEVPKEIVEMMASLSLREPHFDLETLPKSSFFLHVEFTFRKSYLSKDDEAFYVHENPISKEKVFKTPYIRASSWKGNLRWSALRNLIDEVVETDEKDGKWRIAFEGRARMVRIFGNEKEHREDVIFDDIFKEKILKNDTKVSKFNQEFLDYIVEQNYVNADGNGKGRLICYPTFFDRIGLDVINPHDREKRRGTNPIILEVVPRNTVGDLYLLYVPFDMIGEKEDKIKKEIKEDLLMICEATRTLLTEYGMSAKRTSGYGSALINGVEFKSILLGFQKHDDLDGLINTLSKPEKNSGDLRKGGVIG